MNYDRVILELLDRIAVLEEEVEGLKKELGDSLEPMPVRVIRKSVIAGDGSEKTTGRDSTKYILDGRKYGKNRLVLAVVKKYVDMNPGISAEDLMSVFKKEIQGSLGVVRVLDEVRQRYSESECKIRFFTEPDEIIHTSTEDCTVCTQWGIANIGNMLAYAEELGIEIQKIG